MAMVLSKEFQLKRDKPLRGLSLAFQLSIEHNKVRVENKKIRAMTMMMTIKISNFDKIKRLSPK